MRFSTLQALGFSEEVSQEFINRWGDLIEGTIIRIADYYMHDRVDEVTAAAAAALAKCNAPNPDLSAFNTLRQYADEAIYLGHELRAGAMLRSLCSSHPFLWAKLPSQVVALVPQPPNT